MTTLAIWAYLFLEQDLSFSQGEKSLHSFKTLSSYYAYCRDHFISKFWHFYIVYWIYALYTGAVFYYIPAYAYENTILTIDGHTDGIWTTSFVSFTILILVHNL